MNWRLTTAGTSNSATVDVHPVAEFGAIGMVVWFPIKLLQPSPGQMRQWLGFVHAVVADKQPRSIEFAEYENRITQLSLTNFCNEEKTIIKSRSYRFYG